MDKKQNRIFKDILQQNNISNKAKLIKYRNLKEFRYFTVERINPNHILELYGKLKNGHPKKESCNTIHVGRIIIPYTSIILLIYGISPIQVINVLSLIVSNMLIALSIYYICYSINIMRLFNDCVNRGYFWCRESRKWKNTLSY